jgi:hypothetical protein
MMKSITRKDAMDIYSALGNISLGHFAEETLEAVISNYNACRKVSEEMRRLNDELIKRLYADIDDARKKECFALLGKMDEARAKVAASKTKEEANRIFAEMKETTQKIEGEYADVWAIYKKHNKVYASLLAKEIEADITEVDADEMVKGVLKGAKDFPVAEIRMVFAPILKAEEVKDADFSELDELLK